MRARVDSWVVTEALVPEPVAVLGMIRSHVAVLVPVPVPVAVNARIVISSATDVPTPEALAVRGAMCKPVAPAPVVP